MTFVTCIQCKWIHFQVSKVYVSKWQEEWKVFWLTLDEEGRDMFDLPHGPPGPEEYLHCHRCNGSYKNFIDAKEDEMPFGSTIGGILNRNEDL